MGAEAPTPVVIPIHCAPKKAPCPECGTRGRRKRTVTRTVRTVAYKAVAHPEITYGEYAARCECCTTFRNSPEGVLPKAHYDNKVRDLVPRWTHSRPRPRPGSPGGWGSETVRRKVAVHTLEPSKTRGFAIHYNSKTPVLRPSDFLKPLVLPCPDL